MAQNPSKGPIRFADIKCSGLPNIGLCKRPGKYYFKLSVHEKTQESGVSARGNIVSWDEAFQFDDAQSSSVFELQVYTRHTIGTDGYIGGLKDTIGILLTEGTTTANVITRKLRKYGARGEAQEVPTVIEFTISSFSTTDEATRAQMDAAVGKAKTAFDRISPSALAGIAGVVNDTIPAVDDVLTKAATWEPLIEKIKLYTEVVDKIAEVHPYAKMAWTVLSTAYKAFLAQKSRDENIGRLVHTMDDIYGFLQEAEPLKKIDSHKQIIVSIMQQTTECAYFIRDYSKNKQFWERTMKNLVSLVDSKIEGFNSKFGEFKLALQGRVAITTEITILRVLETVENISAEIVFGDIPYARGARYDVDKVCLPGTRRDVIEEIMDWVNSDAEDIPRVFLLSGMAGVGKSAIAHSLAALFDELGRLGSSYCFDHANQTELRPDNLFSTVARDLADSFPEWKSALYQVLHGKTALRNTRAPREQFEKFILNPATGLPSIGPLLIVIDALDESGDEGARQVILGILANRTADLPSNFRILVTARAERDILDALSEKPSVISKQMNTVNITSTIHDISCFVEARLGNIPDLERKWPNNDWCRLLVERSEGLFQWASTACHFIRGDGESGLDPVEQMDILLSSTSQIVHLNGLDQLYAGILAQKFRTENATRMRRFKSVMGMILVAKEPLSRSSLQSLYFEGDSSIAVGLIVRPLGSLLSGITDETLPVRPLHTSFRDFLVDEDRAGLFYIDISVHHRNLVLSCFRVMIAELRFNICGLKTSYMRNDELRTHRLLNEDAIATHLSYACRFGTDHLLPTAFDGDISNRVREFLHTRLLFWLEVLSLKKGINLAPKALLSIIEWSKDNEITAFARDAFKFVATFGSLISQSVPHLYLSTLPFSPANSLVSGVYLPQFPRLLRVESGRVDNWPAIQNILEGHPHCVTSVAFSSDGKRIASGSYDETIRVWNVETGEVSEPFEGHTEEVNSVAFSPDGKRIVSGSDDRTIRVWDAEMGVIVSGPFEGHLDGVNSVVFSRDGKRIASGSDDKTIRVWDAKTGVVVSGPFKGHTEGVNSVAFSRDGRRIASGSSDQTIRVWDAETGKTVSGPFVRHTDEVTSVDFSPDGKRIVSGSNDRTIRVWDTETGVVVSGPFEGHTDRVNSVIFSSDGKRIASGSSDCTIRVWDAKTGVVVSGPFEGHAAGVTSISSSPDGKLIVSGSYDRMIVVWNVEISDVARPFDGHTHWVTSVAFSLDGKRIFSGSYDCTIRVWDVETGAIVLGPLKGHTDGVLSIALSRDGKRIVSGSKDQTIRVWNAETGAVVSGPFKGHLDGVNSVTFSRNGNRIVSGSNDRTIRVWDTETGVVVLGPFKGHAGGVNSVAFSPDEKRIISGSDDNTIRVWDAVTGAVVSGPFEGHTEEVNSVAFSPDGKRIVSGSEDCTIMVWNAKTGAAVSEPFEDAEEVKSVDFSPNGRRIASGSSDGLIRVWDAKKGVVVSGPFEGHTDGVVSVAYSPDGEHIVSGSFDKTIRVWDTKTKTSTRAFSDSSRMENGWILNGLSEMLFWVPPWSRVCLWRPNNVTVIGKGSTKLNLQYFVDGTSWEQCREPVT